MNNAIEMTVNVVRFSKGAQFRRFEIAKGCSVATLHSDSAEPRTLDLGEALEEQMKLTREGGWTISTV